jgi:hypothetical protein
VCKSRAVHRPCCILADAVKDPPGNLPSAIRMQEDLWNVI